MKNKLSYVFFVSYFAILIATPGRFVYGFTILFEILLFVILTCLVEVLIKKLKLEKLQDVILSLVLISITILYRQIIILINTEVALVLGVCFYLPSVSLFTLELISRNQTENIYTKLKLQMLSLLKYIIYGMCFYLFRDIAGYGTFTFFGSKHKIFEKCILDSEFVGPFSFFATISGAFILSAFFILIKILLNNKFEIIKKSGEAK